VSTKSTDNTSAPKALSRENVVPFQAQRTTSPQPQDFAGATGGRRFLSKQQTQDNARAETARGTLSAKPFERSLLFPQTLKNNEVSQPSAIMLSIARSVARDRPLSTQPPPTTLAPPISIEAAAADRAAKEERAAWDAVEPKWHGKLQLQLAGRAEDDVLPWDQPVTGDGAAAKITGSFELHQAKSEPSKIRGENREFGNNS
jgi:hypothetical protein